MTAWRLAHYYAVSGDQRILPLLQTMKKTLMGCQFPAIPAGVREADYFGDSIDLVIAEEAMAAPVWLQ